MKKIRIIYPIIMIALILGACNDMLEPDPINQQDEEFLLSDPTWAEGVMIAGYEALSEGYSFSEVGTDDAVTNSLNNDFLRMATGEWSDLFNPVSNWGNYNPIFNMNYFMTIVDDVSWSWVSPESNELFASRFKGEAHALRAIHYFELLRNHAGEAENGEMLGVPIVTEPLGVTDDWALPRAPFDECINLIMADLDTAIVLLPDEWRDYEDDDSTRVFGTEYLNRINGNIAKAIRSRVATYAASPAFHGGSYDQVMAENAAGYAAELLQIIGGVDGMPEEGHLFYDDDNDINNPEIIWRNNWGNSNFMEGNNFPPSLFGDGQVNPSQNLVDAFPMVDGYPIDHPSSTFDADDPYANRDPRLAEYILYNGNDLNGRVVNTDINTEFDGLNNIPQSTRTGYYLKKLLREDTNLEPGQENEQRHFFPYIRYTEVFLNFAEAANEAWGPDADPNGYGFTARDVIAAIRERAGIDPSDSYLASLTTKEQMRDMIRNERRLELSFEGFRFWDLRRWNQDLTETARGIRINDTDLSEIDVEPRQYAEFMIYGPIDQDAMLKYDGLLQNRGY